MLGRLQACFAALLAVAFVTAWHTSDATGAPTSMSDGLRAAPFDAAVLTAHHDHFEGYARDLGDSVAEDSSEDDEHRRAHLATLSSAAPRPVQTTRFAAWLRPYAECPCATRFVGLPRGPPALA